MKLVFATGNPNKVKEIRHVLGDKYEIVGLADIGCQEELPETRDTIPGNSEQKAAYVVDNYQTDCFAEDTGLIVDALDGAPGVYSARYAGPDCRAEDNISLLLKNMSGQNDRRARFVTVITLIQQGKTYQFSGEIEGVITEERSGGGGFGYDPVFRPDGYDKTFAEMTKEEKSAISHRARATRKLAAHLADQLKENL